LQLLTRYHLWLLTPIVSTRRIALKELPAPPKGSGLSKVVPFATLLSLAIAATAFVGHIVAEPALYALSVDFQAMSIVTSLALIIVSLAAITLFFDKVRGAAILCLIGCVLPIGALAGHAFTGSDGLNPLVAALLHLDPASAGRTSVGTAIGILALATSLYPALRVRHQVSDGLAAIAFLIAVLAISGYAYGFRSLYALPFFRTMGLNTAFATLALSIAAVLGRREGGWAAIITATGHAGTVTRRQLLFLLVPPMLGWILVRTANAGLLGLGSAMALLVVLTVGPLLWLILHDGRSLTLLERERMRRAAIEAEHLAVLEAKLTEQATELGQQNQSRLERAEATTMMSEGRYRSLFDSIDAGFCVVELRFAADGRAEDYRFLEVNAAFAAATGLIDAKDRWMRDLAPNHEQHWFDIYGEVASTRTARRFENGAEALDDRWYDVHAFPVDDPALHHVGILFNDVTARRSAELALREMNVTLEQRVEDEVADRERARSALRQSQKMEALGKLTGGVAHDFNNLLTPIVGSLDMLARRNEITDRDRRLLQGALQAADRAKTLVQRLLAFARRQPLQMRATDIRALVEGMVGLVISTSGPQVRVVVALADDLAPVLADANQLEMAILNLCVNARDAMPRGGTLTITGSVVPLPESLRGELPAARYVRLTVGDTGVGMDAETLRRAIEPFYSTKGLGKGTGLGLSMVHGLAGQSNGVFDIRSEPDIGTQVDLWLPLSMSLAIDRTDAPASATSGHSGRVLVVDDEATVRMTTVEMLQDLGYHTVDVPSADRARALLVDGERFDIVITDHLMPGMKGADLARAIQLAWPYLPVLLVTGYADVDEVAADLPRLSKPFRQDDLAQAVTKLLAAQ